jgi:hypothetical protein
VERAFDRRTATSQAGGLAARLRGDGGSALGSWLVQAAIVLAIVLVVGYEAIAIGVTAVAVDDAAGEVARTARDAYRSADAPLESAERAAEAAADVHRAEVQDVAVDGEELTVTLSRRASTLLLHRFDATDDLTVRTASGRAALDGLGLSS